MNILPRILYLLQTVPIKLPTKFFSTYQKAYTDLIWGTSRPRFSYFRLTVPKFKRGIGLPELRKYHQACHLARIIHGNIHAKVKA